MTDPHQRCLLGDHPPAAGLFVCEHHRQEMSRTLRDIENEALDVSATPSLAVAYDSAGGGAPAFEKAPVRTDAVVLLDRRRGTGVTLRPGRTVDDDFDETGWDDTPSVLETLHAWARLVRDERCLGTPATTVIDCADRQLGTPLHGPAYGLPCWHPACSGLAWPRTIPTPATVHSERALLTKHLDWCCAQPWVDELHQELHDLLAALRRTNNTLITSVGSCESVRPDGSLCDGRVWHVIIKPDGTIQRGESSSNPDDEPGFRCGTCRRVWTGTEAVRLRDRMWRDEQERKGKTA